MKRSVVLLSWVTFLLSHAVLASTPERFTVTTSHGGTESLGVPFKVLFIALDQDDNVATSYSGSKQVDVAIDAPADRWGMARSKECHFISGVCATDPVTLPESLQGSDVFLYAGDGPAGLVDAFSIPVRVK